MPSQALGKKRPSGALGRKPSEVLCQVRLWKEKAKSGFRKEEPSGNYERKKESSQALGRKGQAGL